MPAVAQTLLRRTTCPHCWRKFAPRDVLWISSHADLLGWMRGLVPGLRPRQAGATASRVAAKAAPAQPEKKTASF
jgi:hypothetical protein